MNSVSRKWLSNTTPLDFEPILYKATDQSQTTIAYRDQSYRPKPSPPVTVQRRRPLPNITDHCQCHRPRQTSTAIAHSNHYPKSPDVFLHCPFWPLPKNVAAGIHEAVVGMKGIETHFILLCFSPFRTCPCIFFNEWERERERRSK
jgi:hypothetical protein